MLYDIAEEQCLPPDAPASQTFVDSAQYTDHVVQLLFIAALSTFCNIFVLYFHWTRPPHPKFLLRFPRMLSIRTHVLSGTIEIVASVCAFFAPHPFIFTRIQAAASFVHIGTAIYQTPVVFGVQAVMLPAYVFVVLTKLYCAVDLTVHSTCIVKSLRLYNIHSIYAYCRVFISLFTNLKIMQDNQYTVSIMLAGFICLPSMGAAANTVAAAFIFFYFCFLGFFASSETVAQQTQENSRCMFHNAGLNQVMSLAGGKTGEWKSADSGCPFASRSRDDQMMMIDSLFKSLDTDSSGKLSHSELKAFSRKIKSKNLDHVLDSRLQRKKTEEVGLEEFSALLCPVFLCSQNATKAAEKSESAVNQAKLIFDMIDTDNSGEIQADELAAVLTQYSLPSSDVQLIMQKYDDDHDGSISFQEFLKNFKPFWQFQFNELTNVQAFAEIKERRRIVRTNTAKSLVLSARGQVRKVVRRASIALGLENDADVADSQSATGDIADTTAHTAKNAVAPLAQPASVDPPPPSTAIKNEQLAADLLGELVMVIGCHRYNENFHSPAQLNHNAFMFSC